MSDKKVGTSRLVDYLSAVLARVPTELIAPGDLEAMMGVCGQLPRVGLFGFESHLATGAGDFAFAIRPEDVTSRVRADPDGDPTLVPWREALSALEQPHITGFFMEYDTHRGREAIQKPAFFCGLSGASGPAGLPLVRSAIDSLTPAARPAAWPDALDDVLAQLPEQVRIIQVGLMPSRPDSGIRLLAQGFEPDSLTSALAALGWPAAVAELEAEFERLRSASYEVNLSFDVAHAVGPRIGLEMMPAGPPLIDRAAALDGILGPLTAAGLCSDAQAEAIRGWEGVTRRDDDPLRWPDGLTSAMSFVSSHELRFNRYLNHVKVVFERDRVTEAKAYLATELGWGRV